MIKDFKINSSGDLVFEENTNINKLKINFNLAKTNSLKILFDYEDFKLKNINNSLKIKFDFIKPYNNKIITTIQNEEYLIQQIKIRLETVLGELNIRKNIGSKLELMEHENLKDINIQNTIISYIKDAIKDLFNSTFDVMVKPAIYKTANNYCQSLLIYISVNNNIIFKYILK